MAEHLLAVLFALASALCLLFAVLWLRALAAYEDRSKAFERAAADCVRLEGELDAWRVWKEAVGSTIGALFSEETEVEDVRGLDVGAYHSLDYLLRFDFGHGEREDDPELFDALAALSPAEAEDEQHAHAEHLREAREHQEEKHGE